MKIKSIIWDALGWVFGLLALAIGLVNVSWWNDLIFGVFICLLALVFVPQVNTLFKKITGIRPNAITIYISTCEGK
jgi:putative effector of murein hydrolase LrgA (UPF0299 family)